MFDRERLNFLNKWWFSIDKVTFLSAIGLMFFGTIIIISASPAVATRIGVDKLFFVQKHLVFVLASLFFMTWFSFMSKEKVKQISVIGFIGIVFLMILVLLIGDVIKGSRRWLFLFHFSLQPSEFVKPFFIVFNAYLLEYFYGNKYKFLISSGVFAFILFLLIMQPDFGMSVVLTALFLAQLFLAGLSFVWIYFFAFLGVGVAISAYMLVPHVTNRINVYLANLFGEAGKSYQVEKAIDAMQNGGILGQGPVEGTMKNYIPDAHTDFIFAVIGEEFGMIVSMILIFVFFFIGTRILIRNVQEKNLFIYLASSGLALQFLLQATINIGVTMGLLPTKGMTLPFISYGGSSILSIAMLFGFLIALTKKSYENEIETDSLITR